MSTRSKTHLTPEMVLRAYALGVFPMAESRYDPEIYWVDPKRRGILPLENFHLSHSLRKTLRKKLFDVRCDYDFAAVIDGCAEAGPGRMDTWINPAIRRVCLELFQMGLAHSVEAWRDGELVGGLYGIALGGAFFGESMFSRETDASKAALAHLVLRLRLGGFTLLDTQFVTDHLRKFGAVEIGRSDYRLRLGQALATAARFQGEVGDDALEEFLQSTTQTS